MMRVNWVFATGYNLDPTVNIEQLKSCGPTWGSWGTWRGCGTDNVICHDQPKLQQLLQRNFQANCNFYMPNNLYGDLGRPQGVRIYNGEYLAELDNIEDVVALHLVAPISDIVLLAGFNLAKLIPVEDRFELHKLRNYHGLVRSTIATSPTVQWVVVDHPAELDKAYRELDNITCDTMENVLQLIT